MIKVVIPTDEIWGKYYDECKRLYESLQGQIQDENSFDFVANNTFFYMFLYNKNLLGGIYFFDINGKLFLNAFASRKHHLLNLICLKESLKWFDCDIYAKANNKMSVYCLLKCGFKRLSKDLFYYRHSS